MIDRLDAHTPLRGAIAALALVAAACTDSIAPITLVIEAPTSTELTVGDDLLLTVTAVGGSPSIFWTASDTAVAEVVGGWVEARRPGSVTITARADGATPAEIVLTVVARPGGYTVAEIDYFGAIAFGSEFSTSPNPPLLRRWQAGPRIHVNGTPTAGDLEVVDSVVAEINRIVPGYGMQVVTTAPSVEMHFIPQADFRSVLPEAPLGNNGIVWVWWDTDQHIYESVVLISTTASEGLRRHIIREELTQMLGLLMDSFLYPLSIFYQPVSTVTEYQPIDRVVIELLHRPELTVGSPAWQAVQVARTLLRPSPGAGVARAADPPVERAPEPPRGRAGSGGSGSGSR